MDARSKSPPLPSPPHPGQVLRERYLEHYGISQAELGAFIGVSASNLSMHIHGHRAFTAQLAWALSMALGTTPEFWMELQAAWDLHHAKPRVVLLPMPQIDKQAVDRRGTVGRGLYLRKPANPRGDPQPNTSEGRPPIESAG